MNSINKILNQLPIWPLNPEATTKEENIFEGEAGKSRKTFFFFF